MSTGSLRTKISLKGGYTQLAPVTPFYGVKQQLPPPSPLLGSDDLISFFDLSSSYSRLCGSKKLRDDLASFLPQLCGTSKLSEQVDPAWLLRRLVEKPPIKKEIVPLSSGQLVGFKLAPGSMPPGLRLFDSTPADSFEFAAHDDVEQQSSGTSEYHEFGKNFHDPEEEKAKHRKKRKRSLDNMDDSANSSKTKRVGHKEKKQKKKKKDKKHKNERDSGERQQECSERSMPFY
ncbi:Mediator complex [Aphelenchoides avenae]|nr:Mediator complex [Aphelenchus avenae]